MESSFQFLKPLQVTWIHLKVTQMLHFLIVFQFLKILFFLFLMYQFIVSNQLNQFFHFMFIILFIYFPFTKLVISLCFPVFIKSFMPEATLSI